MVVGRGGVVLFVLDIVVLLRRGKVEPIVRGAVVVGRCGVVLVPQSSLVVVGRDTVAVGTSGGV